MTSECLPALTLTELLVLNETETEHWHRWFESQPATVLDVPLDIANLGNVRGMLRHIFWVELRYAERILQITPETPFEAVTASSVAELFAFAATTRTKFRHFVEMANQDELDRVIEFHTLTAGQVRASKRKVFLHAMFHGVRHWAQLATVLRAAGHKSDWAHDVLYSPALT